MRAARMKLKAWLYPPRWVVCWIPPLSFAALILIFKYGETRGALAALIYGMSAYSLVLWCAALPRAIKRMRSAAMQNRTVRRAVESPFVQQYLKEPAFRVSVGVCRSMAINFLYMGFRVAMGIRYASVWMISIAVYYLALGGMRAYLIVCGRRGNPDSEKRCYRNTARLLFLLNIPMGGMIVQMVRANSGFSYPGYVIYLSAMYTFYTMTASILQFLKFRRLGSPILSAAKVLNLISAMMSVLGLQTTMIARFSERAEQFRRTMNAATGSCVYGAVILIALGMLLHSKKMEGEAMHLE